MPQNFFITGLPKSGKTTVLSRIVADLRSHGLRVGGFISPEEKTHGTRTGFYVKDTDSGEISLLADVDANGPRVSKYHVDVKSFEDIALPSLRRFKDYDVIVIDEIGRMELKSQKFSEALDRVLESSTPLIASLHSDYVDRYGQSGEVIFLEDNNREETYRELVDRIKSIGRAVRSAGRTKARGRKPLIAGRTGKKPAAKAKEAEPKQEKRRAGRKAAARKAANKPGKKEAGKKGDGFMQSIKDLLGF